MGSDSVLKTIELEMKLDNEGLLHHEQTVRGTPFSTALGDKPIILHGGCLIVPRPVDNRPIILDHSSWDKLEADLIGRNELLQLMRPDGARWRINSIIVNDKDRVLTLSTSMDNTRTTRQLRCQVRNNGLYPREDDNQVGHIATTQEASPLASLAGFPLSCQNSTPATTHHTAIFRGTYETAYCAPSIAEWKVQRILNHNSTPALVRDLNKCESEGCWLGFVRAPGTELGSNYSYDYPTVENALIIDANPWKTSGSSWIIGDYGKVNIHDNAGQHHVCQWRLSHERGRVGVIEDSRDGVDSQQTNLGFIAALTKQPVETTEEGNATEPVSGLQFASVKELLAGLRHKHTGPQFRFIEDGRKGEPWYLQAVCKTPRPATQVCPGEEWDIHNCVTLTILAVPNTPCTQIHMRFSPADGQLRVVEWGLFKALGHENWLHWLGKESGDESTQGTSKYYIPEWQQGLLHQRGQRILSCPANVPIEELADKGEGHRNDIDADNTPDESGILDHNSAKTIVADANKLPLTSDELFCFVGETGQNGPSWRMHSISVIEDGVVWLRLSTGDEPFGVWLRSCGGRLWHMSSPNLPDHWSSMKLLISPSEDVSDLVPLVGRIRHLGKGSPEVELADVKEVTEKVTEKPSAPAVTNIDHSSLDALMGGLCEVGGGGDAAVKLFRMHGIVKVLPDRWFCFVNDAGEEGPSWRMGHIVTATKDKGKAVWMSIFTDADAEGDPGHWKTTNLHLSLDGEGRLRHWFVDSVGASWDDLKPLVVGSESAADYDHPSLGRIRCLGIFRSGGSNRPTPIEELADAVSEHRRKRSKGFNVCTNCNRLVWTETDDLCRPCQLTALKHDAAWEDGKLVVGSLFADNNSDNPSVAETTEPAARCTNCRKSINKGVDWKSGLCSVCHAIVADSKHPSKHWLVYKDARGAIDVPGYRVDSMEPRDCCADGSPPLSNKVGLGKPSSGKKLPKPWPRWVKTLALLAVMAVAYNANCIIEYATEWKAGPHTKALVHRAAATWEWVKSGPAIRRVQNKRESTAPPKIPSTARAVDVGSFHWTPPWACEGSPSLWLDLMGEADQAAQSKRIASNTVQSGPTPPSAVSPSPIVQVLLWAIILVGVLLVCAVVMPCRSSGPISSREALSEVHHPTKESKNGQ